MRTLPFCYITGCSKSGAFREGYDIYTMTEVKNRTKIILKFTDFSRTVLYGLAACILLWLNIKTVRLSGLAAVLAAVCLSLIFGRAADKYCIAKKHAERLTVGICCLIFWLLCMWWVTVVPYVAEGDQAIVWTAASLALEKDFSMYAHGGQMFIYPQQQGLAFLYELLFRLTGSTSWRLIGYVNACLAPVTLFFGYQSVKECADVKAALRFLPLMMLCLPYIFYSPYVYGDIPSVCCTFILFWAVLKFLKTKRYRYGVLSCAAAALALLCRKNIWIFFIGLGIGLIYHACKTWSMKPVILALSFMLCASLAMGGVKQFNSIRSGYPVSSGMPAVLWMAMGMQYSERGAGYYNNYSKEVYIQSDYDNETAADIGIREIKDRIKIFLQYPDQCRMFFEEKISSQWTDSFFEALSSTGTFDDSAKKEIHPAADYIYRGNGYGTVKGICDSLLFLVYFFALIGVCIRYFKKKDILSDAPLISIVGGFLFCIIWEAKSRYMLPYYILLFMYAAYGLAYVSEILEEKLLKKGKA